MTVVNVRCCKMILMMMVLGKATANGVDGVVLLLMWHCAVNAAIVTDSSRQRVFDNFGSRRLAPMVVLQWLLLLLLLWRSAHQQFFGRIGILRLVH